MTRRVPLRVLSLLLALFLLGSGSGCLTVRQTFYINPDGSGKMLFEAEADAASVAINGEVPPDKLKQYTARAAKDLLDRFPDVVAWSGVAVEAQGTRIHVRGTAYFQQLADVLRDQRGQSWWWVVFLDDPKGGKVLRFAADEGEDEPRIRAPIPEEEMKRKIAEAKKSYTEAIPGLRETLKGMRIEMTYKLPGAADGIVAFTASPDKRELHYALSPEDYQTLVDALQALVNDDAKLRDLIETGRDVDDADVMVLEAMKELNRNRFGKAALSRARVRGDLAPLFDFDAEAEKADKAWPALRAALGVDALAEKEEEEKGPNPFALEGGTPLPPEDKTPMPATPEDLDNALSPAAGEPERASDTPLGWKDEPAKKADAKTPKPAATPPPELE